MNGDSLGVLSSAEHSGEKAYKQGEVHYNNCKESISRMSSKLYEHEVLTIAIRSERPIVELQNT